MYVVECVGAVRAWLSMHPCGDQLDAPLFPSHRNPLEPMWPQNINGMLVRLTKRAGMRHVKPHLLRHTRATRAACNNWADAKMRAYFGWSPASEMPSLYTHLVARNMEDQVRRDAGIDDHGNILRQEVTDGELEDRLKAVLKKLLLES